MTAMRPSFPLSMSVHTYMSTAGATPNDTTSEMESYERQKLLSCLINLASRPSSVSKKNDITMKAPAHQNFLKAQGSESFPAPMAETISIEVSMDRIPKHRLPVVNMFGRTGITFCRFDFFLLTPCSRLAMLLCSPPLLLGYRCSLLLYTPRADRRPPSSRT